MCASASTRFQKRKKRFWRLLEERSGVVQLSPNWHALRRCVTPKGYARLLVVGFAPGGTEWPRRRRRTHRTAGLVPSQSSESTWRGACDVDGLGQGTSTPEREAKALIKGFDLVGVRSGAQLGVDLRKPKGSHQPGTGTPKRAFPRPRGCCSVAVRCCCNLLQPVDSLSGF